MCKNNIVKNGYGLYSWAWASDNLIYHNNFINNTHPAYNSQSSMNIWDNGYPSGGNYWSDYNGTDFYSGPYQNETGSDNIGDIPYIIDENNQDRYPLTNPLTITPPTERHDIALSLNVPEIIKPGNLVVINATVSNLGLIDETEIELQLFINDTIVQYVLIPKLSIWESFTLTYQWVPAIKGVYNITAYTKTVIGEKFTENNFASKLVEVKPWFETIYIRADGSIDPPDVPLITYDNITYVLTDLISSYVDGIVVEKDNVIIDGTGHILQGSGASSSIGIYLNNRLNITIKNMIIKNFNKGIYIDSSAYINVYANHITDGIYIDYSSYNNVSLNNITNSGISISYRSCNNFVSRNNITNGGTGVYVDIDLDDNTIFKNNIANNKYGGVIIERSWNNKVIENNITNNDWYGICVWSSYCTTISRNNIAYNNYYGIWLDESYYNVIMENNIINNRFFGVVFSYASNNKFYHNNFIGSVYDYLHPQYANTWDDGYPSGGNYWSDYTGADANSDGLGDTPYVIDANNVDRYPLMNPWGAGTPVANFSWSPSVPEVGELVTFDASASMPIGGEIVSYEWDFGDGSRASGKIVTHKYSTMGTFTVTLNVTDSEGLWDIEQKQIEVKAPPPPLTVTISPMSASILVGQSVTFTSTVSGGYAPYTYQWFLNGNPFLGATSNNWTFTPTSTGIFYVYLTVKDAKGNIAQSDAARIAVATVPVGGYSIPIQTPTKTEPILPYIALIATLTITMTKIRNKTKRRR